MGHQHGRPVGLLTVLKDRQTFSGGLERKCRRGGTGNNNILSLCRSVETATRTSSPWLPKLERGHNEREIRGVETRRGRQDRMHLLATVALYRIGRSGGGRPLTKPPARRLGGSFSSGFPPLPHPACPPSSTAASSLLFLPLSLPHHVGTEGYVACGRLARLS